MSRVGESSLLLLFSPFSVRPVGWVGRMYIAVQTSHLRLLYYSLFVSFSWFHRSHVSSFGVCFMLLLYLSERLAFLPLTGVIFMLGRPWTPHISRRLDSYHRLNPEQHFRKHYS